MTFYLPNPDVHPVGSDPCEFLDLPSMADDPAEPDNRPRASVRPIPVVTPEPPVAPPPSTSVPPPQGTTSPRIVDLIDPRSLLSITLLAVMGTIVLDARW
jgi:hypothetical protein